MNFKIGDMVMFMPYDDYDKMYVVIGVRKQDMDLRHVLTGFLWLEVNTKYFCLFPLTDLEKELI